MVFIATCTLTPAQADALEVLLCEYTRSCWTLTQIRAGEPYTLSGYFDSSQEAQAGWDALRADFPDLPMEFDLAEMPDRDWQEAYKDFLEPWASGGLHWVPEWQREEYAVPPGDLAVYFDAGMAFGTGSHPTTRLMARRLLDFRAHVLGAESALAETVSDLKLEAPSVIDAGCGSGILAVSAAKLGFRGIYAFDQDPEAATVTRENTERNNLEPTALEVRQAGLEDGLAGRRADLILANIISDVLVIYREPLVAATAPGGWLALSGILAPEADEVRERFVEAATAAWGSAPACLDQRVDGEWADVLLVRAG